MTALSINVDGKPEDSVNETNVEVMLIGVHDRTTHYRDVRCPVIEG